MTRVRDSRWVALAMLVGGLALVTYGWFAAWVVGADDRGVLASFTYMTHWTWFATAIIGLGIVVSSIRRDYLPPRVLSLGLIVVAMSGGAIVVHGVKSLLAVDTVETSAHEHISLELTIGPWLALLGFALLAAAGLWLWRLTGRKRQAI